MSENVEIALIMATSSTLPSIVAAVFAYMASTHAKEAIVVALKTEQSTNGMKDQLVSLTAKSSLAEGILEGRRQANDPSNVGQML